MEAETGIYDMVYIEQDIIYAYLARNFLVDITKALKDDPSLKAPDFDEDALHHLRRLLQERRRRPLRRPDGSLHQDLPLPDRPLQRSRGPGRLQGEDRQGPGAGDDPRGIHRDRRVLHRVGQGARADSGAPRPRPTPATRPPGTSSSSRSRRPSASTTGASTPTTTTPPRSRTAADEQRRGQGGAEVLAAPARHRPAGVGRLHLDRGRRPPSPPAAPPRASSTARTPPGSPPTRSSPRSSATSASRCRRPSPACSRKPRPAKGYIGYYDGGAFGLPVTSKNKEAALLFLQYIGQDSVQPRLGRRRAAHHQHGDLRRPRRHRAGREARRLLHDAARTRGSSSPAPRPIRSTPRSARRPRRSSTRS